MSKETARIIQGEHLKDLGKNRSKMKQYLISNQYPCWQQCVPWWSCFLLLSWLDSFASDVRIHLYKIWSLLEQQLYLSNNDAIPYTHVQCLSQVSSMSLSIFPYYMYAATHNTSWCYIHNVGLSQNVLVYDELNSWIVKTIRGIPLCRDCITVDIYVLYIHQMNKWMKNNTWQIMSYCPVCFIWQVLIYFL